LILVSTVIITTAHNCYAFSYDDIESIDDIYRYYYSGQIDQAQFEYLMAMFDIGRITYEDLLSIGIIDPAELAGNDDSLSQSGIFQLINQSRIRKIGFREYFQPDEVASGNYYCSFAIADAEYRFKIRSKVNKYYCDNRSIRLYKNSVQIELGNYLVSEGYGLTIGRFDYQPSAGYNRAYDFDFWSPINSYYNGVKTEYVYNNFSGRFYLSTKYYDITKKRFSGGGLSFNRDGLTLGVAGGYNYVDINTSHETRMAEGLFFAFSKPNFMLGGEVSQVNRSAACYLTGIKVAEYGTFAADFWSYARHFENYNCSGKAASDYHSFYPADEPIGFRSAQAGETGAAIRMFKRNLALGYQTWKQVDNPELNVIVTARHTMSLDELIVISNQMSYMLKNGKGEFWWKGIVDDLPLSYLERLGFKIETHNSGMDNGDCYGFFGVRSSFKDVLDIRAAIRGYFDGAWRLIITEKTELPGGFYLATELVYGNNWRANAIVEKTL
jgi:hypothetical protein